MAGHGTLSFAIWFLFGHREQTQGPVMWLPVVIGLVLLASVLPMWVRLMSSAGLGGHRLALNPAGVVRKLLVDPVMLAGLWMLVCRFRR